MTNSVSQVAYSRRVRLQLYGLEGLELVKSEYTIAPGRFSTVMDIRRMCYPMKILRLPHEHPPDSTMRLIYLGVPLLGLAASLGSSRFDIISCTRFSQFGSMQLLLRIPANSSRQCFNVPCAISLINERPICFATRRLVSLLVLAISQYTKLSS